MHADCPASLLLFLLCAHHAEKHNNAIFDTFYLLTRAILCFVRADWYGSPFGILLWILLGFCVISCAFGACTYHRRYYYDDIPQQQYTKGQP